MTLSVAQQTALQAPAAVPIVYFAELGFASATQYYSSWNHSLTWGGNEWLGLGQLGNIGDIETSENLSAKSLTLTLNMTVQALLSLSLGNAQEYTNGPVNLYFCPLENGVLIDTPVRFWTGYIDSLSINMDGEHGSIVLRCEAAVYRLSRQTPSRINAVQHKQRYPNDTGLDFLATLLANPQVWVSKKFQQV